MTDEKATWRLRTQLATVLFVVMVVATFTVDGPLMFLFALLALAAIAAQMVSLWRWQRAVKHDVGDRYAAAEEHPVADDVVRGR